MGNTVSCLCPEKQYSKWKEVLVMKENGEVITFTKGAHVKDILAAYPHHNIIKCSSIDQSYLPASSRLCCNRLYFLLPEGLAVCNATYGSLIRTAMYTEELRLSKAVILVEISDTKKVALESGGGDDGKVGGGKVWKTDDDDVDYGCKKAAWKPSLQTVHEVGTPLHGVSEVVRLKFNIA